MRTIPLTEVLGLPVIATTLEALGRPHCKPRFQRVTRSGGHELSRPGTALLKALEKRDGRRGKDAALIGVARRSRRAPGSG